MAGLFELKQQRETALTKADSLLTAAEHAHRELTSQESAEVDMCMVAVKALTPQITAIEKQNTIRKYQDAGGRIMPGRNVGRAASCANKIRAPTGLFRGLLRLACLWRAERFRRDV